MPKNSPVVEVNEIVKTLITKLAPLLESTARECAKAGEAQIRRELMSKLQGTGTALAAPVVLASVEAKKKQIVSCPVPSCKRPGVKPLHCFCQHHYDTLAAPERDKLRAKQIEDRKQAAMH